MCGLIGEKIFSQFKWEEDLSRPGHCDHLRKIPHLKYTGYVVCTL